MGKQRAQAHKTGGQHGRVKHAGNVEALPVAARSVAEAMLILDYVLAEIVLLENTIHRGRLFIALAAGYVSAIKIGEMESRIMALETALKMRSD